MQQITEMTESLSKRLDTLYEKAEVRNVQSIAVFRCVKGGA